MAFRLMPGLALLLTVGCDLDEVRASSHRYTEDFHQSHALKSGGRFELEGFNGSVEIYGWDQDRVEVNGTKYASSKDMLDEIKIDISSSPEAIVVRAVKPEWGGRMLGSRGVRFRIHVPRKTQFDRVTTSNGSLRLEGVEGRSRLRTSNGPVRLTSYQGDVEATTSNGPIALDQFTGSASLSTSNAKIEARGVRGFLDAHTSNSAIEVETANLDPNRPVKLETSNGPITVRLAGGSGPEVRAKTSNAPITLKIADGAGARVRARTSNSNITSDFPLNNVFTMSKTHMDGSIGTGGPLFELTTSNGPIRLVRD